MPVHASSVLAASATAILSFPSVRPAGVAASECQSAHDIFTRDALRSAFWNALSEPVILVEPMLGKILDANPAASRWLARPVDALVGARIFEVLPELLSDDLQGRVGRRTNRDRVAPNSLVIRDIALAERVVDVHCSPLSYGGRKLTILMLRPPAREKRSQAAFRDPLTGLPDRRWFDRRLRRAFRRAQFEEDFGLSILFVDLDRFKPVNDEHGHPIGDEVLRAVAHRLLRCVRPQDMVSRRGGDEFTILLDAVTKEATARRVAERIMRGLEAPVTVDGREFTVSASVGISVWSSDHSDHNEMLEDADVSMYRVKRAGGKGYAYGFTRHDRLALAK